MIYGEFRLPMQTTEQLLEIMAQSSEQQMEEKTGSTRQAEQQMIYGEFHLPMQTTVQLLDMRAQSSEQQMVEKTG